MKAEGQVIGHCRASELSSGKNLRIEMFSGNLDRRRDVISGPGWVLIMAGSLTDSPLPDHVVTSEQFWQENCSLPFRRLPSTPGTGHRPPGTLLSPPSPRVRTQVSLHWVSELGSRITGTYEKYRFLDFPDGTVGQNPPANAGDVGSIPGPGRVLMPWSG